MTPGSKLVRSSSGCRSKEIGPLDDLASERNMPIEEAGIPAMKSSARREGFPVGRDYGNCPQCGCTIRLTRLPRHLRDVHKVVTGNGSAQPRPNARVPVHAADGRSNATNACRVRCPHCRAEVNDNHLASHLRKVHGIAPRLDQKTPRPQVLSRSEVAPRVAHQTKSTTAASPTSRTGGYCYPLPKEGEILRDLLRGSLPEEALVCTGCWRQICRVRGLNFSKVSAELWREICERRGYLYWRENPRGW